MPGPATGRSTRDSVFELENRADATSSQVGAVVWWHGSPVFVLL